MRPLCHDSWVELPRLQSEDKNAPKDLVDLIRLWDHRRMASGEPAEQSHTPDVYFRECLVCPVVAIIPRAEGRVWP